MGNTCYLAAAVQMMGSLPSFLDDLALSIEEGAAGVAEGGLCLCGAPGEEGDDDEIREGAETMRLGGRIIE